VEVQDAGPGIPPEEQWRIWEKFYRGTTAPPGARGTGIGLAVVKAVVEAQGGTVGLESAPGRGSRFWFDLPGAGEADLVA
jgi:signal transduction histidine kinase